MPSDLCIKLSTLQSLCLAQNLFHANQETPSGRNCELFQVNRTEKREPPWEWYNKLDTKISAKGGTSS